MNDGEGIMDYIKRKGTRAHSLDDRSVAPEQQARDEYDNLLDPEARAREELPPAQFRERERLVNVSLDLTSMPCLGGACDLDDPCPFHSLTGVFALHIVAKMKEREDG